VPPIHIEAFAGRRLDADISVADNRVLPQRPQIVLDDGEAAIEAERMKVLRDHRRIGVRVFLEQLGDGRFPAIDFAGAFPTGGLRRGCIEIFRNRAPADAEVARNLPQRPLFHPVEPMQFADLVRREHLSSL
jgi:hypothetical protein